MPTPDPHKYPLGKTHGEVLTELSDGMVALLKDYYGALFAHHNRAAPPDFLVLPPMTRGSRIPVPPPE
jgi:hypothetical protein